MTFRAIAAVKGQRRTEVNVSIKKRSDGSASRIRVSMHEDLASQLGWKLGMKVQPQIGEGQDEGFVRLRLTDRRGFLLTAPPRNTTRLSVTFPAPKGSPEVFHGQTAEFRVSTIDRSLTIRLPWVERNTSLTRVA